MIKPVFNSLGSNYNFFFVLKSLAKLFTGGNPGCKTKLVSKLSRIYQGKAYLFYKGRDALEFALRSLGIGSGDKVIMQGFSCAAVEEAITRTGALAVFADTALNSVNPSVYTLDRAFRKNKGAKALVIQHTFGLAADIDKISHWCRKHKVFLIEDLAQAVGAMSSKNQPIGSLAEAVVFSFGRDKVIDAVCGGACVIKNGGLNSPSEELAVNPVSKKQIRKDLLYPLFTYLVRITYAFGLGKLIHWLLRRGKLIASPVASVYPEIRKLPDELACLALTQFSRLGRELEHRRLIAGYYFTALEKLIPASKKQIESGADLRVPIIVPDPQLLIGKLKEKNIYLADRWYRQAVDCGSLNCPSAYQPGSCPNAEALAKKIVNLPTHRNISFNEARRIAKEVKKCLY